MSKHSRRLAVGMLVALIAAVTTMFLSTSPSQADPKKLRVSSESADGPWADNLTSPLFETDSEGHEVGLIVPQDVVTDTFWVQNNSAQPARATLAVVQHGNLNDLEQSLEFTSTIDEVQTTTPVIVGRDNRCKTFVTGPSIAPRESQQVDVKMEFLDVQGQIGMDQTANVDFVLTLSQVGPKGKIDICGAQAKAEPFTECKSPNAAVVTLVGKARCPEVAGVEAFGDGNDGVNRPGALAATGAPRNAGTLVPLSLGLLLTGAVLMFIRRRREAD